MPCSVYGMPLAHCVEINRIIITNTALVGVGIDVMSSATSTPLQGIHTYAALAGMAQRLGNIIGFIVLWMG